MVNANNIIDFFPFLPNRQISIQTNYSMFDASNSCSRLLFCTKVLWAFLITVEILLFLINISAQIKQKLSASIQACYASNLLDSPQVGSRHNKHEYLKKLFNLLSSKHCDYYTMFWHNLCLCCIILAGMSFSYEPLILVMLSLVLFTSCYLKSLLL